MTFIAKFVSYVFHPLFMPALGIFLVMSLDTSFAMEFSPVLPMAFQKKLLLYVILPFTVYFPLSFLLMQYIGKNVKSLRLETREERIPIFMGTFIFYLTAYFLLKTYVGTVLPATYYAMVFGGALSVLIALLVTYKWKISIHAIGVSGVLGTLMATAEILARYDYISQGNELTRLIINFTLIAGAVCSARLALNAHNIGQIIAGMVVGFCSLYFPVKYGFFI